MSILSDAEYWELIELLNGWESTTPHRKSHRLDLPQYSLSEHEYFFTICARHQKTPFTDPALAAAIIDALMWRRQKHHWRIFCYCLMPDHLHFILQLQEAELRLRNGGIRGFALESTLDQVGDFKSYTTSQIWWPQGGNGLLWQKSSYDKVIRCNDSVESAVSYVLNNSVRKGLVETWSDYPYAAVVDEW
ncbi:MAG: REP-associated tyrosine transposase [Armatimonadota bacterium]